MGGFENHGGQLPTHHNLLGRLDGALGANYTSLEKDLQLAAETTNFTEIECGRTGNPTSSNGPDRPWGSRRFDLGGSVTGGEAYGTFPAQVFRGPDDAGSRGLWIQKKWTFPNLRNFSNSNIGFLR
eukprot:TRINITY_DN1056_c0_g1_i24.p3 TRINITY_DN1056_c0_g1~~TRINITY_DN1056_c0_g1_i24.p3  ORF type:complete len:126 (+),score=20.72 TRINITY_DN1056_c0_g1_i24:105-482(+)